MTEKPLSNKIRLWVRFIHLELHVPEVAFESTAEIGESD